MIFIHASYMQHLILQLTERLQQPLPGAPAQYKMAALRHIQESEYRQYIPDQVRRAAVMILLYQSGASWHTILIRRSAHPNDRHSGQISFPGGSCDPDDATLTNTALRELHEETGVPPNHVEIIGQLTEIYIPVSNFLVHPVLGWLKTSPEFRLQPGEVEAVLMPNLMTFFQPEYRKKTDIPLPQGTTLRDVPYFDVDGHIVWGATAMMISELVHIVEPFMFD